MRTCLGHFPVERSSNLEKESYAKARLLSHKCEDMIYVYVDVHAVVLSVLLAKGNAL